MRKYLWALFWSVIFESIVFFCAVLPVVLVAAPRLPQDLGAVFVSLSLPLPRLICVGTV